MKGEKVEMLFTISNILEVFTDKEFFWALLKDDLSTVTKKILGNFSK